MYRAFFMGMVSNGCFVEGYYWLSANHVKHCGLTQLKNNGECITDRDGLSSSLPRLPFWRIRYNPDSFLIQFRIYATENLNVSYVALGCYGILKNNAPLNSVLLRINGINQL